MEKPMRLKDNEANWRRHVQAKGRRFTDAFYIRLHQAQSIQPREQAEGAGFWDEHHVVLEVVDYRAFTTDAACKDVSDICVRTADAWFPLASYAQSANC